MKNKSASQSAFFNLRLLTGLFLVLTGVFLALLALRRFSAQAQEENEISGKAISKLVPPGVDCSQIRAKGIDKQENFRAGAIMIFCHESEGGSASGPFDASKIVQEALAPFAFGTADVDLVTGTETSPHVIQSETYTAANPDNPQQVLVAYNDSRGAAASNFSGLSVSTDGGTTFTRVTTTPGGQSPFANTFGDPVALYNKPTGTWFTIWLDGACGGQGIGGYKSTTPDVAASWTHFPCIASTSAGDRESGWADNNPASPGFGNMYVSYQDFNVGSGALLVHRSTDNGATWGAAITVSNTATFIRDVQITGDMAGNGDLYIAGMDEGGGSFPHNDTNYIFRSTDRGLTWANTYVGPAFAGPGVTAVGYFAQMFSDAGGFWRHEGWGEPAAYNHVVHLVYSQHGAGADAGDVYYIRSTDSGTTFGAPLKLNTDATTRPQWQVNLSASPTGTVMATWYDGRESATCTKGNPAQPCYRMWSRKSNDNGVSWLPDDTLSDVVTPLPGQADPNIQPTYAGDYDYGSALLTKHMTSWTDGRVAIASASQQDTFTDREQVGFGPTTTTPACGSIVFSQPVDFVVNLSDPVNPGTVQASDFTVNAIAANSFVLGGGNTQITFHYNSTPVTSQGLQTMSIAAGAFNRASDNAPNLAFSCTFRYDALLLQVTTTVPAVGGVFSPPAPGVYQYDVNFNEAVDPASVQTSDLVVGGTSAASVTGVSMINANMTARFTLNINFGGTLTASIAAAGVTDTFGNPNGAFSGNYTVQGCPPAQYVIAGGVDPIVPGTTDVGNHIDDGDTVVALPFPFTLYGNNYSSVNVNSNGRLDFVTVNEPAGYITACLPAPPNVGPYDNTIFGLWEDMRTDTGLSGCASLGGCGIFTSVSGVAPNRIFNIEWRAVLFANNAATEHFEVRLYENSIATGKRFDVIYGALTAGADHNYVGGVQGASTFVTQDFCSATPPASNVSRIYTNPPCASLTATGAVSRKVHGAFNGDINLPLSGSPGIECRSNGNTQQMIVTFANPVTVSGSTTPPPSAATLTGIGAVSSITVASNVVTVNLTGVTDVQQILMTLLNVSDGTASGDIPVPMKVLIGDSAGIGNSSVGASDVAFVKSKSGQTADATNFRADVAVNGSIGASDVALTKSKSGNSLP